MMHVPNCKMTRGRRKRERGRAEGSRGNQKGREERDPQRRETGGGRDAGQRKLSLTLRISWVTTAAVCMLLDMPLLWCAASTFNLHKAEGPC
jgi:hypothetical protein